MKFSDNLAKVLFVLSLVLLVFLYGFWAGYKRWPPKGFLDLALDHARDMLRTEPYDTQPKVYDREGAYINDAENIQPGMTLITSLWDFGGTGDLGVGAKLIDSKGSVIHTWKLDRNKLFPNFIDLGNRDPEKADLHGTYLFPNGDLLLNLEYIGTVRVNACGKVKWRLLKFNHHSIHRDVDGTFWIPAIYSEKRRGSKQYPNGFPGLGGKTVIVDRILQVSEDGEILKDINLLDVLYINGLERYIPKMLGNPDDATSDITHLNDVEPLNPSMAKEYPFFEAGDLLVSAAHLDLVFVFDPETLKVKWHALKPFKTQHDPDFIGNGWIGVFDNNEDYTDRGTMLGGSRIVALQPHTGKKKIRFPTYHSDPFYTKARGKWQMLGNGNMLLTEAYAGRIVEVAPDGSTVWEWIHEPINNSRVPEVTKATRYDLTEEDVASWPCSSVSTSENTEQEGG